jgi:peptidyl-prolyl cis-trans isomerase C
MRKTSPTVALSLTAISCLSYVLLGQASCASRPAVPGQAKGTSGAPAAPKASEADAVVARIGEYTIVRKDLEDRMVRALRPQEAEYPHPFVPVTAEATVREMLGEKAMSLEGRQLGYLKDEMIHSLVKDYEEQLLVQVTLQRRFPNRVTADPNEVDRLLRANPKWSRAQATAQAEQAAALQLFEAFYQELTAKFHLKVHEENFAQAAQVHQRLLERPAEKRGPGQFWITNPQIANELSEQEKNLVLAAYDGGSYTLKDWFQTICNLAPPRRPADLSTPAGVGKLLDRALRSPLLVAEARIRDYDKDAKLRRDVRQFEDRQLLSKVRQEKIKAVKEPTADEVKAYFEKNKDRFARPATMKINPIWCKDLETAKTVKTALDGGADFETVKKTHSLRKEDVPYLVSETGEGLFWAELWKGEPNSIVGPVKGFYGSGVKWRVVKILEKTPAQPQAYSEQIANDLKWTVLDEQQNRLLAEYRAELLQKYPPEIRTDKIKDLDAFQIALTREDK